MSVKVYTIPELEPILHMKKRAIRRLITDGRLRANFAGRQYLVAEESVKYFLDSPDVVVAKLPPR